MVTQVSKFPLVLEFCGWFECEEQVSSTFPLFPRGSFNYSTSNSFISIHHVSAGFLICCVRMLCGTSLECFLGR